MISAVLAVALASAPAAQAQEWSPPPWEEEDEGEGRRRLFLSAWAGEVLEDGGAGRSSTILGGEVAWAFEVIDLGAAAYGYRDFRGSEREWTPVLLVRLTQRFRTRGGVEGAFGFGVGAGRPDGWEAWFQAAVGVRVPLGPVFLGGEIAFEQLDLLRLSAGLGIAF